MNCKNIAIAFLLLPLLGITQEKQPIPITKMVMKQWTGEDGLISNNLTSVNQTKDGFLWMTSFNGLHRFDGNKNLKLFDKEGAAFLKTNSFQSVTSDKTGVLIATEGSGVVRYQEGKLFPVPEFQVSSVFKLMVDSKGRTWCGTNLEGLHVRENGKVSRIKHDAFKNVLIQDIYEDSKGRIWVATEGNGLLFYDGDEFNQYNLEGFNGEKAFTTIIESISGELIFGTVSGLYSVDFDQNIATEVEGLQGVYINDLAEDADGLCWIASERGLFRVNKQTGYFEAFNERNGLPAVQVSAVAIDHEGSIWLSTKKAGLVRLSVGSIDMIGEREGLLSKRINTIEEINGRLFIGSDDGSIHVKDGTTMTTIDLSTKKDQVGVRDFFFDAGMLWVASYQGLHLYQNGREKIMTTKQGLSSNLVRRILKSSDGSIWLASRTGGAMRLQNQKVVEVFNKENGLNSDFVLAIEEDRQGNIVLGTHSGGISILGKDKIQNHQAELKGLVNFNIHVDDENRYWISTSAGVYLFENETFKKLNIDTSFKNEAIFDFVMDLNGNAWMTSTMGIISVSKSQLDAFVSGEIDVVQGRIFDNNDGMTIKECTGATRSTLLPNGKICFPTLNGVAVIDPEQIQSNDEVPKIVITSFSVDDQILKREENEIDPGKLRYQFEFVATSYLAANRIRFRYKLTGLDEKWTTTENNQIEYTNLPPDTYTFSVIGSNGYGLWNEEGDELTFTVRPFYYQTLVFRAVIALLIVVIFYFIFIWRVRRVQAVNSQLSKVNSELDRFVYSASHDIRAPLTSILGATKIAIDQPTAEEKNVYLGMIRESAKKLDGFIRDIIDYSRNERLEVMSERINVRDEITSIADSLKYLDESGKVKCTINAPSTDFETDVRRLRVVLKNLIANAFFYHNPKESEPFVLIDCEIQHSNLKIVVSDNGIGMKKEVLKNIFTMFYRGSSDSKGSGLGLYIVKENIDKLNGKIEVDSDFEKGSTFTLHIPQIE